MKTNLNEHQSTPRVTQTDIRTLLDAGPMLATNLNKHLARWINQFGYMSSMAAPTNIIEKIGFVTYKVRCYHNAIARTATNFAVMVPQYWLLDWFTENNLEPVIFATTISVVHATVGEEIGSESDDAIESYSFALSHSKDGWVDLERYIYREGIDTLDDDQQNQTC